MDTNTRKYTIDAAGKKLGRLATQIATILNGKDTANFEPRILPNVRVEVTNVSKIDLGPKKIKEKTYTSHTSGYMGGQKIQSMATVIKNKGVTEVLKLAVYGMIPENRSRGEKMKKLIITE